MSPSTCFLTMAFQFNMLLDQGRHLELADVKVHIADATLFDWLPAQFESPHVDLNMLGPDEQAMLVAHFQALLDAVDERRIIGVVNEGLCLLLGYCLDGLRRTG